MTQHGTIHDSEVADSPVTSVATDARISHLDGFGGQPTAIGASSLRQHLEAPVLAAGEKIEVFWKLAAEVWDTLQPNTFLERLEASDLCHALWEERRFRRHQAALPAATGTKALQCLLASSGYEKKALQISDDYFGREGEEGRTRAVALLERFGITEDAIAAQAIEHNVQTISLLERLMNHRQSRRDRIIKGYQRRKRKTEKPGSPQADQLNGTATH
jgi:hypothetical protein